MLTEEGEEGPMGRRSGKGGVWGELAGHKDRDVADSKDTESQGKEESTAEQGDGGYMITIDNHH